MKQATAQHCMKSCNVKQNSESVFHYFASVKDFYAICSHSSFKNVGYVPLYPFRKATGLLNSLCTAHQPDGIHPVQTHLIRIWDSPDHWSVRNKEFTLWGRDLVSVVCIRKSPYYRGFFLKKLYENFVGTLETVRNREVSVLERCPYQEVPLYLLTNLTTELINNYMYMYVMQHLTRIHTLHNLFVTKQGGKVVFHNT